MWPSFVCTSTNNEWNTQNAIRSHTFWPSTPRNLVECQQTTVSNLFINKLFKKYHFNCSFENELKEKLLACYTVVFFPIQSDIFVL